MSPKNIHLIRHAQGYHNLSVANHNILDPLLTSEGKQRCIELSKNITNIQSIDCIVASPMRRALYTALFTFRDVLNAKPGLKIIALPDLQETSSMPCDIGNSLDELRMEFKAQPVDFSFVDEDWNNKLSGKFAPRTDLISRRALRAREFLYRRPERELAVVTHGGLLHFLTEDWEGGLAGCGTGWANCEMRTFTFRKAQRNTANHATLVETKTSLSSRVRNQIPLTPDEQLQLQLVTQRAWAADGYIILAPDDTSKPTNSNDMEPAIITKADVDPFIVGATKKAADVKEATKHRALSIRVQPKL